MSDLDTLRRRLDNRWPLIGGWIRRQALRALAEDGSPEALWILRNVAAQVGSAADAALQALADQAEHGDTTARDALCSLVIHHDHPEARRLTRKGKYVPRDADQRAVDLFLTGQWQAYEALDFTHDLLRTAYDSADESLRKRIAAKARQAGRMEWLTVVHGVTRERRLGTMSPEEWKATLTILEAKQRWEDLWRIALDAPPRWSSQLIVRIALSTWRPADAEPAEFDRLVRSARGWIDLTSLQSMHGEAVFTGHEGDVRCLIVSPDHDYLVSGSSDRTVRVWPLQHARPRGGSDNPGARVRVLDGSKDWIQCLAMDPGGRFFVSGDRGKMIHVREMPDGKRLGDLKGHKHLVSALAISGDGELLASGSADGTVRLWDMPKGQHPEVLQGHQAAVLCLEMAPDGAVLASGGADSRVFLWDAREGRRLARLSGHKVGAEEAVLCLAMHPEGNLLASGGTDGRIRLWSVPSGRELAVLDEHEGQVTCLAISPRGDVLASGGTDHKVCLWTLPDGHCYEVCAGHAGELSCLSIRCDGRVLASCCGGGIGNDFSIRLWSLPDGEPIKTLLGHDRFIHALAFAPDGRALYSGSGDGVIRQWTSEIVRLGRLPAAETTLGDLQWVEKALQRDGFSDTERRCLEFLQALLRWRRRGDIAIDEARPRIISVGEFDIEIGDFAILDREKRF